MTVRYVGLPPGLAGATDMYVCMYVTSRSKELFMHAQPVSHLFPRMKSGIKNEKKTEFWDLARTSWMFLYLKFAPYNAVSDNAVKPQNELTAL